MRILHLFTPKKVILLSGLVGTAVGALIGIHFLKKGFNLGRAVRMPTAAGWAVPAIMAMLLIFLLVKPDFIFFSQAGPGSRHVPLLIGLGIGLVVGFLAQRTRMCFVGAWRDLFLVTDSYLVLAIVGVLVGGFALNIALGQFSLGFDNQPISHADHLGNFLGMTVVGLGAILVGGCPLRQLIMAGEGDTDAGVTVLGLLVGAAVAHNFGLASSAAGPTMGGKAAVVIGLLVVLALGFVFREKIAAVHRIVAKGQVEQSTTDSK